MKTRHYISFLLSLLLGIGTLAAQNTGRLYIPDLTALPGNTLSVPVYVENTTEIVAVQFTLQVPEGATLTSETAALTNRAADHTVTLRTTAPQEYLCVVYSPTNSPIKGRTGKLMTIDMPVPSSYAEGSTLALTLKDAVLSLRDGSNVLSSAEAGTISIAKAPDLSIQNVFADKTAIAPGEVLGISWQVQNVGGVETGDGWTEQISLVQADGTSVLLGTTYYDDTLSPSGTVSRQATVTLPQVLGLDGQAKVQVQIVPRANTGESEGARGNNTATTATAVSVGKLLALALPTSSIEETYAQPIRCTLTRSGNRTQEQTFILTATADSRLTIPTEVTIPAGQSVASFYIQIKDNTTLDDGGLVTITASGNDYEAVSGQFTIEDNEYPDLTLTASKSEVTEGESFHLTITASRASAAPLEVTLTSENSKRFSFPTTVTIPAGETSTQVTVQVIDDELPSLDLSNAFTASAAGYNKGEVLVILKDNDLPVLELTLTPTTVSEGAGVVAVAGVLKRTTNKNSKITVKLSDDANGGLYFGNRTLELAKGVEEVHFNFGPVDNALVDGDRTYTITAAVWLSSCSCGVSGESAGYVTAQLQVLDNDGAALNLTSSQSTVKEGGKTTLTISRNTTDNVEPLTVILQSDYDENLTYNHTVTIPAGQTSTTIEVTSNGNDVQGDNHTVVFTAQAEGYATGTCYLMVTDQTLPDARITSLKISENSIEANSSVDIEVTVSNDGVAILSEILKILLYVEGQDEPIGSIYTQESISPSHAVTISKSVIMPNKTGNFSVYAVVNESRDIEELNYANNRSENISVSLLPTFTAIVNTDKQQYKKGEPIIISGKATGSVANNTEVEIYVISDDLRQTFTTTSDTNGNFSMEWTPYSAQMGHFSIGACYPGEGLETEQVGVDVLGMRRATTEYLKYEILLNEPYNGFISVINPMDKPLSNIKAKVLSLPENYELSFSDIEEIGAHETSNVPFKLIGRGLTAENKWEEAEVEIYSENGATLIVTFYLYCRAAQGLLKADIANIQTTMVKGDTREYPFNITNIGKGNTGNISLSLPSWMKSATPMNMVSLNQGETTQVVLLLSPTDDMQLNNPRTGTIAVNCENGEGLILPFNIEPVSDKKGTLIVDVCDVYTFNTPEAPHVSNAQIVLKNPTTGTVVVEGTSKENGQFECVVPEGWYMLNVSAEKHDGYSNYILIDPGRETNKTVVLDFQAITVNWQMEETEVDDTYDIVTIVNYETNVPMPVVLFEGPNRVDGDAMKVGETKLLYLTLTNKGLISAQDVTIEDPDLYSEWSLQPLAYTEPFVLAPQQSVLIPVLLTRTYDSSSKQSFGRAKSNPYDLLTDCMKGLSARYKYLCGSDIKENKAAFTMAMKFCGLAALISAAFGNGGGGSGVGTPNGNGSNKNGSSDDDTKIHPKNDICDPEVAQRMLDTQNFVLSKIPIIGYINEGLNIAADCAINDKPLYKPIAKMVINSGVDLATNFLPNKVRIYKTVYNWTSNIISSYNLIKSSSRMRSNSNASSYGWIEEFDQAVLLLNQQYSNYFLTLHEIFGDCVWYEVDDETMIPFWEHLKQTEEPQNTVFLKDLKPESVSFMQLKNLVERINNSTALTPEAENRINPNALKESATKVLEYDLWAQEKGYETLTDYFMDVLDNYKTKLNSPSNSVCSSVSLEFKQTMTMTRQAFMGSLTVYNGHENTVMQDLKLNLVIKDYNGNVATSHEFQINVEELEGFTGELDLGSGWTLGANETGTATILFIPTKYAAPTEPVEWSFGGTLSYIDPFTGLEVTRDLYPVTLTVKPSPELDLTYFMQRDVYGDDPLTEDVVEPMVPAEFSLLINNIGNGDAINVHMVTNQPKIIENEKGLLIDFEILSAQLNGGDKTLALGGSVASDFGTIPAHSQAYAQWWLTSSLLGHFTSYDVQATHVTSYDNPDLSLLNEVTIHELIRSIKVDDGEVTGFVVNDLADAEDTPDMLYFTDGTTAEVVVATSAAWQKQSNTEYVLTVTPSQAGWNYGHVTDPTFGHSKLIGIRRQSDGKEINLRNFWQTDRTLRDGKDWLYENNLHFVDQMANSTETYILTFEPRPDVELQVASFSGVPEEGVVLREPLQTVTVTFNKAIDAETFTREDITLSCQGTRLEGNIGITQVNDMQFNLDLSQLTAGNGYYVLTIQTADITDFEGFNGAAGKTATWIQFTEATTLALSFYDAEVTYGNSFTEPRILTNSPAVPTFTSTNPLVASVSSEGRVTINAVGTTQVNVALEETPMSDAAQTSYRLTVLQPEGSSEAPAGIKTVSITIPEGQTMTTFCSPWPIDFSDATNDCRAYMAFTYSEDIVECAEVIEAKGGAGLLIVGKPGTYTFPVRTSFYDPIENLFVGTLAPTYVEEMNDDKTNLGLKDIKFVPLNAGVIKANTAYLPIAMDDNVDAMTIVLKAMTGLRIITEQFDEVPWFNISGMKVSRPSAKGIYIHNGRKVVVQ